jgi:para-nitrobenzyl esterase
MFSSLPARPLAATEEDGLKFGVSAGAGSLAALRAMSAEQLQDAIAKSSGMRFSTTLDGYFLPKSLAQIFDAGQQSKVPLLAGSNSEEQPARAVLGSSEPTPENFASAVRKLYGDRAEAILKAYAPSTPEEVLEAATHLASARFVGHSTWKWTELQAQTSGKPVYRYFYSRPRPRFIEQANQAAAAAAPPRRGAAHSAEIQYAMGNLDLDKRYAWEPDDYKVSATMQAYFVNFIKTGNPNGSGLPHWPGYNKKTNFERMRLDVNSVVEREPHRERYVALDAVSSNP